MKWKRIIAIAVMMGLLCPFAWAETEKSEPESQYRLYDFRYFGDPLKDIKDLELDILNANLDKGIEVYFEDIPKNYSIVLRRVYKGEYTEIGLKNEYSKDEVKKYLNEDKNGKYIEMQVCIKYTDHKALNDTNNSPIMFSLWGKDYGTVFCDAKYSVPIWHGRVYHKAESPKLNLHVCAACQIDRDGNPQGMAEAGKNDGNYISDQAINWDLASDGIAYIELARCFVLESYGRDRSGRWVVVDDRNKDDRVKAVALKYSKIVDDAVIPQVTAQMSRDTEDAFQRTPFELNQDNNPPLYIGEYTLTVEAKPTEATETQTPSPTAPSTTETSEASVTESSESATSVPTKTPVPTPTPEPTNIPKMEIKWIGESDAMVCQKIEGQPNQWKITVNKPAGGKLLVIYDDNLVEVYEISIAETPQQPVITSIEVSSDGVIPQGDAKSGYRFEVFTTDDEIELKLSADRADVKVLQGNDTQNWQAVDSTIIEVPKEGDQISTVYYSVEDENGIQSDPVTVTVRRVAPINAEGEIDIKKLCIGANLKGKDIEIKGTKDSQYAVKGFIKPENGEEIALELFSEGEEWSFSLTDDLLDVIENAKIGKVCFTIQYTLEEGKTLGQPCQWEWDVDFVAPAIDNVEIVSSGVVKREDDVYDVYTADEKAKIELKITAKEAFSEVFLNGHPENWNKDEGVIAVSVPAWGKEETYALSISDGNLNVSDPVDVKLYRVGKLTGDARKDMVICPNTEKDVVAEGEKDVNHTVSGVMWDGRKGVRMKNIKNEGKHWNWVLDEETIRNLKASGAGKLQFTVYYDGAEEVSQSWVWQFDYLPPTLSVDSVDSLGSKFDSETNAITILPGENVTVVLVSDDADTITLNEDERKEIPASFELIQPDDISTYDFVALGDHGNESTLTLTVQWFPEEDIEDIKAEPAEATLGPNSAKLTLSGFAHPGWRIIVSEDDLISETIPVSEDGRWKYELDGSRLNGGALAHDGDYEISLSYPAGYDDKAQTVRLHWDAECALIVAAVTEGDVSVSGITDPDAEVSLTLPDGTLKTTLSNDNSAFQIENDLPAKAAETYMFSARDNLGNSVEKLVNVGSVDNNSIPRIDIVDVSNDSRRLTIKGAAGKGYNVVLSIKGAKGKPETVTANANNGIFGAMYECPEDGEYTISARYEDYFSGYETEPVTAIIDTTAPEIMPEREEIDDTSDALDIQLHEEFSQPVEIRVELDDEMLLSDVLEIGQLQYTIPLDPKMLLNKERIVITATDAKGNIGTKAVSINETANIIGGIEGPNGDSLDSQGSYSFICWIISRRNQAPESVHLTILGTNRNGEKVEAELALEPMETQEPQHSDALFEYAFTYKSSIDLSKLPTGDLIVELSANGQLLASSTWQSVPVRKNSYIMRTVLFGVLTLLFAGLFLYSNKMYRRMSDAQIDRKSGESHMTIRSDRSDKT